MESDRIRIPGNFECIQHLFPLVFQITRIHATDRSKLDTFEGAIKSKGNAKTNEIYVF